ncbi:grpE protein homolog 2, mitochondrial isoform X2 [Salmo salar]|uniref:GrpE protein homolog 2, mitochondrial isoform X2 n=1 Tax=Salmo salar TaxID=8030 RepID=A0A1S3LMD4_SALSA|nr:grpE protein homolog 2, mitochondrial-like isoform X2 [Salmo salar]|eukprot:XP_013992143.1 PREDICTED: grpE protein homolog 2, mitochondrial-like isoform X2 [Salmo salar]
MAMRCLFLARKSLNCVGRLQLFLSNDHRALIGLYSTAAKHWGTGDNCNGDDTTDDSSHTMTNVRLLEMRASKLEEQVRELTERYKRAMADSDNVRKRTQKFVQDAKLFGIQSFCRELVEVADLLEKTTDNLQEEEGQRLAQVQDRLQGIFTKHGLNKMSPVGDKYDPYQHEIVCHTPAEGGEPSTVTIVKQDGYKLHGRTIRHAQVGIAVMKQD